MIARALGRIEGQRIWLFLSRSFHGDPHGRLPSYMERHLERSEYFSGAGVELHLYERAGSVPNGAVTSQAAAFP